MGAEQGPLLGALSLPGPDSPEIHSSENLQCVTVLGIQFERAIRVISGGAELLEVETCFREILRRLGIQMKAFALMMPGRKMFLDGQEPADLESSLSILAPVQMKRSDLPICLREPDIEYKLGLPFGLLAQQSEKTGVN